MRIRRATRADLRQLCITAMRAFAHDPVMRWLHPDDVTYFEPGGEVLRGEMTRWLDHDEVWCTDDVTALAVWVPPGRPEPTSEPDPPVAPPPPELLERFEIVGPLLEAHAPDEPHWYLQLLATHPDWQRRGLGAALMKVMFERADREGLLCHLETETLVNVAYYRRHGFDVHAEFDIPTGAHAHRFSSWGDDPSTEVGPHMWAMERPAR